MPTDSNRIFVDLLHDAHSIEAQALLQLELARDVADEPRLAQALLDHRTETWLHEATIERLLSERGAAPSDGHDEILSAGGLAFAFFQRAQGDSTARLAAHMYAYEALEAAGYGLLARFAERLGDGAAAEAALEIRDDEVRMMDRLASLLDITVATSLKNGNAPLLDRMRAGLADAYALELQSVELLEAGAAIVDRPPWHRLLEEHLRQTKRHRRLIEQRLDALGADNALLAEAAVRIGGLSWSTFFRAQRAKLPKFAAFMYAFEHLEAAGYAQLHRIAEFAGDLGTQIVVDQILLEEKETATRFSERFEEVADLAALD